MMEVFAWIGAIFLGGCALPQAWQSYREGHSRGLAWGFIGSWFIGEVSMLIYIVPMRDPALIFNYVLNFVLLLIMLRYKIWERKPQIEVEFSFTNRSL
jgi:uncharacterized protein with PQ loop repeat